MESGNLQPILDEPYTNLLDFMDFDPFQGLCIPPSSSDNPFPLCSYSPVLPMPFESFSCYPLNIDAPASVHFEETEMGGALNMEAEMAYLKHQDEMNSKVCSSTKITPRSSDPGALNMEGEMTYLENQDEMNLKVCSSTRKTPRSSDPVDSSSRPKKRLRSGSVDLASTSGGTRTVIGIIPSPPMSPLSEKMLEALSLFKESSGTGILAQVWMPTVVNGFHILSTSYQPYLFDKTLANYRELSRGFYFSSVAAKDAILGLPGRVFTSKRPEWTSSVLYYNKNEYLRVQYARDNEVRGSLAVPVFNPRDNSCCAVLEVVTVKEKSNFNEEMKNLRRVLQKVNLTTTTTPRVRPQCVSGNKKKALAEISYVLAKVCRVNNLPLALTWIPTDNPCLRESSNSVDDKKALIIHKSTCYVNNRSMQGFLEACMEHFLKKDQGVVGRALNSTHPYFFHDIKDYDINDYPLVHHARKFGLNAAMAIKIRSTHTGEDDYILEFFLPVNCVEISEQNRLLTNLSVTMQNSCESLTTISDAELTGEGSVPPTPMNVRISEPVSCGNVSALKKNFTLRTLEPNKEAWELDSHPNQRDRHVRRSRADDITRSILHQHFHLNIADAAKKLDVCSTTLKKKCRDMGIEKWPSRQIKKLTRVLSNIRTVIESVHGEEAGRDFENAARTIMLSLGNIEDMERFLETPTIVGLLSKSSPEKITRTSPQILISLLQNSAHQLASIGPGSMAPEEEMGARSLDVEAVKHIHQTSSDSSQSMGSASSTSKNVNVVEDSSKCSMVKARYNENAISFKFRPSAGVDSLFEEVAQRFKLTMGTFQLTYKDDADEDAILVQDSDLKECLAVSGSVGTSASVDTPPSIVLSVEDLPVLQDNPFVLLNSLGSEFVLLNSAGSGSILRNAYWD